MKLSRLFASLASLSLVSVVPIQHAEGQCRVNDGTKLTSSDAVESGWFGFAVSVSGDVAVIGMWRDDDGGPGSGSAYVYRLDGSTWVEEQKLTASDAATGDQFGWSVSISGDVIVVGANSTGCCGAAYVFRFDGSTWVEEQVLTGSSAEWSDQFGNSVSVGGDVAVVGAWRDDNACPENFHCDSGSAFVYRFDGSSWVEEQELTASDAVAHDGFGESVSVSGDVVVIGAPRDDDAGTDSGSAYVYEFDGSTWVEGQKLIASDGAATDYLGTSVSVSGDVAVVGAWNGNYTYVYRFNEGSWVEEQKLVPSDTDGGLFGVSVSISGSVAVVGARTDDDMGSHSGSAYVYRFDGSTWVEKQKLTASNGVAVDYFGKSVSVSGDVAVVGAYRNDAAGIDSGSAYVFGVKPAPSDPPCGAIDARQPLAPNGSGTAGWDSITMTFDEPPGEMNVEDFAVVISPPGNAPTVTDVTVDGNTATIHFDGFIPTKAWTTLTHWPTGAVTRIGYLPADANNDKLSNANDVLYLIDVLNGVIEPAPPAYQTDTDRSGATNASDVLRVIDLLNGAAVYDEHLGAELPA